MGLSAGEDTLAPLARPDTSLPEPSLATTEFVEVFVPWSCARQRTAAESENRKTKPISSTVAKLTLVLTLCIAPPLRSAQIHYTEAAVRCQ